MRLVFLGPPGAGKGTQASRLSDDRGLPHVSTGDMLRDAVRRGSETGKAAERYMDEGLLVPDEVVIAAVRERVEQPDVAEKGFIFDGFPRTMVQAEALREMLEDLERPLDAAIDFCLDDEVAVGRIAGRRTCPECHAVYHVTAEPPAREGTCDECGTDLVQREDDREETVRERLAVYRSQTAPLEDHYEDRGLYVPVEAEGSVEEVHERLLEALDEIETE